MFTIVYRLRQDHAPNNIHNELTTCQLILQIQNIVFYMLEIILQSSGSELATLSSTTLGSAMLLRMSLAMRAAFPPSPACQLISSNIVYCGFGSGLDVVNHLVRVSLQRTKEPFLFFIVRVTCQQPTCSPRSLSHLM